jgi:LuxR family maltose regulon positive regulatory protein
VSAPAGFGKTTLIGEWVSQSEHPAAWLSLEVSDNDPIRFLSYFIAALQTIKPRLAEGLLANFHTLKPAAVESVLTGLLNEIAEIEKPVVLVLDDYHLIQDNSIHGYLSFLLEHLPAQLHLVLSTRADPPFSLTLLRARGQMTELRSSDLRFTDEETAEFLNKLMGLDLPAEDVTALAARTEGWIAGLQMAAVSIRGREDVPEFIRALTSSNRYILDYLLEEVLQRQPDSVQTFLLKTSILERLTGPLCEVLSGQKDGQEILQKLERDNLFIFSIDTEHRWYRYHRLFADLLRRRLKHLNSERVTDLHRRAGEWYEQNNMAADAIEQTLAGQDFQKATELIEKNAESSLMRSEFATFLKWIETLPE